jgi:hypothetical protein
MTPNPTERDALRADSYDSWQTIADDMKRVSRLPDTQHPPLSYWSSRVNALAALSPPAPPAPPAPSAEVAALVEWQPIVSAPKDGTFVLLTDARYPACHLIAQWSRGSWWGQRTSTGRCIVWEKATHWVPLPAPPQPFTDAQEVGR